MKTSLVVSRITRNELKTILQGIEFPTFVSMVTRTPVGMNKTDNPYLPDGIFKTSEKCQINTGFDYVNSVNNRLKKEGKEPDFKGGEGRELWFNVISKGLVTDRKTGEKFYFRYQYLPTSTQSTEFSYKGDPIGQELFSQFERSHSNYGNQGLDNPLMFQVCDLRNILEMSIGGHHYELTD